MKTNARSIPGQALRGDPAKDWWVLPAAMTGLLVIAFLFGVALF
jgi:hypothetical protein